LKEKVKKVKEELKFSFNAPNLITLSRLILSFVLIYMLFAGFGRIWVAILFAITALTDMADGWVARRFNQTSPFGARLDQVTDRIFIVIIILGLIVWGWKTGIADITFILMLFLVTSREIIGLFGVIVRVMLDKDLYEVRYIGKFACWPQGVALTLIIAGFDFAIYFAILACLVGIVSGFDYLKRSFI
jgi:phosphatidylglycerophosphate synthase